MELPDKIFVGEREYFVNYKKVNSLRSSVKIKNGELFITLSRYLLAWDRDKTVKKFIQWGSDRLSKHSATDFINPIYADGGRICTHNKVYELNVIREKRKNYKVELLDDGVLQVFVNGALDNSEHKEKIQDLVEKKIIDDQIEYLNEVISELNELYFQEEYGVVKFKRMTSRFGSCSSKGNLNIAYRLLFAPRAVFRYVCAHELAHLKEFNHSKRFWALVYTACEDYKESDKWLRVNGFMLG